jgi:signal transduction histidine kinase/CHASE3 domain sensor protein/ActR/RegA family two-component response regulator
MPRSIPARPKTERQLIGAALGLVALVALLALGATSYATANRWVQRTLAVRQAADDWMIALHDVKAAARDLALYADLALIVPYEACARRELQKASTLRALIADNPVQLGHFAAAERHAQELRDALGEVARQVRSGKREQALQILSTNHNRVQIGPYRDQLRAMRAEEDRLLVARRARADTLAKLTVLGGILVPLASSLLLGFAWRRERTHDALVKKLAVDARLRLASLSELASALSKARTRSQVAHVIVDLGMRLADSNTCTLYVLDESGSTLELIGERGVAPELMARLQRISAAEGNPEAFERMRANSSIWAESEADYVALFPAIAQMKVEGPRAKAFWSVPLYVEGHALGLLAMGFYAERHFSEDDRAFVDTFAKQCAQALLRAQRLSREERERTQREFLAKAGAVLVSSLDYQATLSGVAQLVVPTLADFCAIDVSEDGMSLRQVAVAHSDPDKLQLARDLGERYPQEPGAPNGAPNVLRTGKSELYGEIPPALLEHSAQDEEHLRIMHALKLESAMVVPLRASRGILGAMTFVYADSGRRYGPEELLFAEDFAQRAATALENALVLREAEQARAQERLLRSEAEVASRAKDEFLATVSHELRTPLNAILGWTVLLREKKPEPEIERGLAVIERNARAQAKLIEDVLDVSRIISGKLALNMTETDVSEAIATALESVTPAAQVKGIELVFERSAGAAKIVADPDRLQQVVWNLLSNAVKFTPKGGRVTVHSETAGRDVSIRVTDSGEGIRPEALPYIFEPFQQADASTTRRHGGLGLGLAIVKQLVTAHGGSVRALSEGMGHGATFVVTLPTRSAILAVTKSTRPPAADLAAQPGILGAPRLDGLRLLAIDDESDSRAMVTEVLRACGADVAQAASAQEALATFNHQRPDVIISDIGMPGEDGYSLIRRIRALPAELGGRTPAVALTAYARSEDAQRAFAAGFQMHLAKPVEPVQLATVVANLGGRSLDER